MISTDDHVRLKSDHDCEGQVLSADHTDHTCEVVWENGIVTTEATEALELNPSPSYL